MMYINNQFTKIIVLILLCIVPLLAKSQNKVSADSLMEWSFYGSGTRGTWGQQFYMKEDVNASKGVIIVSPDVYGENVIVKYSVMTLTPASVCVAILSASNDGKNLEISPDYNGSMALWSDEISNYFFAFRNEAHGYTPFLNKYPEVKDESPILNSAKNNIMTCGQYHSVEVGRKGSKLWLKINDKFILETIDKSPLKGGKIAFRLRGTAGEHASCLIKDMVILE